MEKCKITTLMSMLLACQLLAAPAVAEDEADTDTGTVATVGGPKGGGKPKPGADPDC
jgi:hypothetical protein